MRKIITSINMSLDGFCDHAANTPDDELHLHFNDLLRNSDTILFGRVTYELMEESWPAILERPTGNAPVDEFAVLIDRISKVVFSRTLTRVQWKNARLAAAGLEEEASRLKRLSGGTILAGSRSVIMALLRYGLLDELQLCVYPSVLGRGLPLFDGIGERIDFALRETRTLGSGVVILHYGPRKE
jgi:dihydrofolate reductase